jgi:N-acyl-D-amino-acid deacylase
VVTGAEAVSAVMFNVVVRGGTLYDGSGGPPRRADVGIVGERIAAVGDLSDAVASVDVEVAGSVVAPGFINVLSHSEFELLRDPRGVSELVQGVTTQILGEGFSMGPFRGPKQESGGEWFAQLGVEPWSRLGEYLDLLERRGIAQNVGSLVGATNLRIDSVGHENRPATSAELDEMAAILGEELDDGALGLGSALIYPPASFASPDELLALSRVVAHRGGAYFSHVRGEGAHLLESIAELVDIGRESGVRAEIYHLKASGEQNWPLMVRAIALVESARESGVAITADMYPYTASSTGLWTLIPSRFFEGGPAALFARLDDGTSRAEIVEDLRRSGDWDRRAANTTVIGLSAPELASLAGMTLGRVAESLGTDPAGAVVDLVRQERTRVPAIFATMSEDNVLLGLARPWVSIGSDGRAMAPVPPWTDTPVHPRNYGAFARFLGRYVRDRRVVSLAEAVRKMTSLPADTLGLDRRGVIAAGYFADLVVFDPETITDTATYHDPHRLAAGVEWVLVNGHVVVRHGEPTGALPGRALRRGRQ